MWILVLPFGEISDGLDACILTPLNSRDALVNTNLLVVIRFLPS